MKIMPCSKVLFLDPQLGDCTIFFSVSNLLFAEILVLCACNFTLRVTFAKNHFISSSFYITSFQSLPSKRHSLAYAFTDSGCNSTSASSFCLHFLLLCQWPALIFYTKVIIFSRDLPLLSRLTKSPEFYIAKNRNNRSMLHSE